MAEQPPNEIRRPIVVYVSEVVVSESPDASQMAQASLRNVHLELSDLDAIKLRDHLTEKINSDHPGAIRIWCKGRLVI